MIRIFEEIVQMNANKRAEKRNKERGEQELRRREVEALEEIAKTMRKEQKKP